MASTSGVGGALAVDARNATFGTLSVIPTLMSCRHKRTVCYVIKFDGWMSEIGWLADVGRQHGFNDVREQQVAPA